MALRTFSLKIVRFKVGRRQGYVPPAMDAILDALMAAAATVGQRHVPAPAQIGVGDTCFYINRSKRRVQRDGRLIECVCYTHGMAPEQTTTNFAAASLPITATQIVDPATQQPKQVVHSYRALFLGQCAILEVEKGGGGVALLAQCLTKLVRTHVDAAFPPIEFVDVAGANLRKSIAAGGGIRRIVASLVTSHSNRNRPFSFRLSRLRDWGGPRAVVRADIEFPDGSHVNKGLQALEEYTGDSGLDSVTVHLRDGQKITGLKKFCEKRVIPIQVNPNGGLNSTDVEDALWNYLDELRIPDNEGWRIIDPDGRPAAARLIEEPE